MSVAPTDGAVVSFSSMAKIRLGRGLAINMAAKITDYLMLTLQLKQSEIQNMLVYVSRYADSEYRVRI